MASFDLAEVPWIRARANGCVRMLGLRDALMQAHEIESIEHPLPIVEFGIHRVLTALVLDALHPADAHAVRDLMRAGRFPEERLSRYFSELAGRFDLFSTTHPFLQDGSAPDGDEPVARLLASQPSGTNVLHWHKQGESDFAVSPGEAAGLLCAVAPFMSAGGAGYPPSLNGAPPVVPASVGGHAI